MKILLLLISCFLLNTQRYHYEASKIVHKENEVHLYEAKFILSHLTITSDTLILNKKEGLLTAKIARCHSSSTIREAENLSFDLKTNQYTCDRLRSIRKE